MAKTCPRCSELFPDDAGFCPFDGAELQKSTDRFLGKTIAARYRLTKLLGSGGMSLVYLARHELISRLSAIKILRPELSRLPEHRERFLREARAVNRINHENIVEITDVGESDGAAYLVMEYVEGESLLSHIQRGPLGWERAIHIAMQVASALARTHQIGIVHRDLKPENILLVPRPDARSGLALAPSGVTDLVKLTDFGIAKVMGEPTLTFNEQLFGTPGYIAPEYVSGVPIDGRADIYSLGVVLYEMVTGRLPFEGRGQSDLLLKPLTSDPIPPSKRVSGLPSDIEALILRCIARDPDARPQDAFALNDALADVRYKAAGAGSRSAASSSYSTRESRELAPAFAERASRSPSLRPAVEGGSVVPAVGIGYMSARWSVGLAELEALVANAKRIGRAGEAAGRAAELARVASEMVPRVERAAKVTSDLQDKVDQLEDVGREFRASLGHAIDVLAHDRSRERAHLEAVRARREALQRERAGASVGAVSSAGPWEIDMLASEESLAQSVVDDLTFQIDTLQRQLDAKNEAHELALVEATGALEGSLSALRRLTNEIERTIDDGIDMLQAVG